MTETQLILRPRDGLTVKDARGYNRAGGLGAKSLPWPLPTTLSGAVRTAIGQHLGFASRGDEARWRALLDDVELAGPLPVWRPHPQHAWQPMWTAPRDALWTQTQGHWQFLNPVPPDGNGVVTQGTWRHDGKAIEGLWRPPFTPPDKAAAGAPLYWSHAEFVQWLRAPGKQVTHQPVPSPVTRTDVHVCVDALTQTAVDGALFSKETVECLIDGRHSGLTLGAELALFARVKIARTASPHYMPALDRPWRWSICRSRACVAPAFLSCLEAASKGSYDKRGSRMTSARMS